MYEEQNQYLELVDIIKHRIWLGEGLEFPPYDSPWLNEDPWWI